MMFGEIYAIKLMFHKEETSPEQVQQLDINNMFGLHRQMEEDLMKE